VPEQDLLLPPSLRDWLPEGHLAFFVSDLVDQLDRSAITTVYEDEERGYPPSHPVMLTKVLVYAYCVGVFSSRRIQRRLVEDVAFRVLAAGNEPDFRTIADFRKTHLTALQMAVDELQLIVGQAVTQETNDKKQLMPMITTIEQQSGHTPTQLLADAGYCSDESLRAIAKTPDRRVHLDPEAEAWRTAGATSTRPVAPERDDHRPDGPQAAHEDRRRRLCSAQRDRRAGQRTDQAGAWLSAIPVAGIRVGAR
jgi:transposase